MSAIVLTVFSWLASNGNGAVGVVLDGGASLMNQGAVGSGREKGSDASASRPQALGQGALRRQLHFQLSAQVLPLKLGVFSHVGGNHALDLLCLQQQPQTEIVHASVVADDGQILHTGLQQTLDQVLWDAAQPKAWQRDNRVHRGQ